jgi:hypothetical protein
MMEYKWLKLLFFIVLCAFLTACSTVTPQPRLTPVPREPKITEKDIPDANSTQRNPADQQQQPAFSGPPAPPVEDQASPGVSTGPIQPHHYIWKDKKGSGRGWENPPVTGTSKDGD